MDTLWPAVKIFINADGDLYSYTSPLIGFIFFLFPVVYVIPVNYVFSCNLPDFCLQSFPMLFGMPAFPTVVGFIGYAIFVRAFTESGAIW